MRISAALLAFLGLADARKRTQRSKKDGEQEDNDNELVEKRLD